MDSDNKNLENFGKKKYNRITLYHKYGIMQGYMQLCIC